MATAVTTMPGSAGGPTGDPEREPAIADYKRKVAEHRDIEAKLKETLQSDPDIDNKVEEAIAAHPQSPPIKDLPEANICESAQVVFVDSWCNTSQPIFAETASGNSQPATNDCTTGTSQPWTVDCGIQTSQEFWVTSKEHREKYDAAGRAMRDSDSDDCTAPLAPSMLSDTSSTSSMPIIFPRVKTWSTIPIKRMPMGSAGTLKLTPICHPRTGGSLDEDNSYQSDKENSNSHPIRNIYTKSPPENMKIQDPTENDGVEFDLDSDCTSADKGLFKGPFVRLGLSRKSKPRRPLHNLTLKQIGQNH